jgi:hypothetical protein
MHRPPARHFQRRWGPDRPRQRGPPCARYVASGSTHFAVPIPARMGNDLSLPQCAGAGPPILPRANLVMQSRARLFGGGFPLASSRFASWRIMRRCPQDRHRVVADNAGPYGAPVAKERSSRNDIPQGEQYERTRHARRQHEAAGP